MLIYSRSRPQLFPFVINNERSLKGDTKGSLILAVFFPDSFAPVFLVITTAGRRLYNAVYKLPPSGALPVPTNDPAGSEPVLTQ